MSSRRFAQIGFPIAVVLTLVVMVLPLPSFLLDLLISFNIATAVLALLVSMNVKRALEFSAFPSLLLVLTLARLALNVSTTRAILSTGDAGQVISTFGNVVVAGSLVVGLVVFLILTVVQFVVVANGSGRVAEVSARFTLDAMPGKQMAIDADLNAGVIDEAEARARRKEIADESDFYGAMDGASKFVKGDAIAGIVIVLVNLLGGFAIGLLQQGLTVSEAISRFAVLSIGDGLVSQIPALLLSVASGIIVTRAAGDGDLGSDVAGQLSRQHRVLKLTGGVVAAMGLVPGLPLVPFALLGGGLFLVGRRAALADVEAPIEVEPVAEVEPVNPLAAMRLEPLELGLSYDLVELVTGDEDLVGRIGALRRKFGEELGFVVPPVRTRDDVTLPTHHYVIKVHGVELGRGYAPAGRVLVIGDRFDGLPGEDVTEPVFGLAARWIPLELRTQAEVRSLTVVDRAALIITHLGEVIRKRAGVLLSKQDTRVIVDSVKETDPAVVEDLTTNQVSIGELHRVLAGLLDEQVSIRDIVRILEAVGERSRDSRNVELLIEAARAVVAPAIVSGLSRDGRLSVAVLAPETEQQLITFLRNVDGVSQLELPPDLFDGVTGSVRGLVEVMNQRGDSPVVACSGVLRPAVRNLLRTASVDAVVIAYHEVSDHVTVEVVGSVAVSPVEADA